MTILQKRQKRTTGAGFVFRKAGESKEEARHHYYWLLRKVRQETKFAGIGFHALRHSYGSFLAKEGKQPQVIRALMGHLTEELRQHYLHVSPDEKMDAVNSLPVPSDNE